MKTHTLNQTLLFSAVIAVSTQLLAEPVQLDPLRVTVTTPLRMTQPIDQTLAATTVITRADIERQQPESVAQLLRGTAGVEFSSNGGAGSVTSLFMRGTESKHTLVLIDGVKVNNPTDGLASWNFLPVSQIERVEIVRGPQSTVWGADAIGGVVNIITRGHIQAGTQGEIRVGAGQQNTQFADANFSAANEATRFNSSLSYRKTDGFNATQADTSGEKDGFEHYALRLQVEQDVDERNTLSATYLRSQGTNDYDGFGGLPDFSQDFVIQAYNLGWAHIVSDNLMIETNLSRTGEDRKHFRDDLLNRRVKIERDQFSLKSNYQQEKFTLVAGLDANKERLLVADGYSVSSREVYGIFAQTQYQLAENWTMSAGLRHDDDEFFGDQTTGNIGLDWQVNPAHSLGTSVSQGYRAPNLMELYGPEDWGPNPNLKAEESLNYEMYWQYRPYSTLNAEVRLFQNEIDNLIDWREGRFINIDKSRIRGAELSASYYLNNWSFNGSLTFQNPKNLNENRLLEKRSREHARFDIDYAVSHWGAGVTLEGQSKRYDFGNQRMGGYALVNTRAHWHLSPEWTLRAKIDNLFDKDYEQAAGYNTQGRYFETSLTYRF